MENIRNFIRLVINNSGNYDEKWMKIKFNSDGNLSLKKRLKLYSMVVVRSVFHENNKYYSKIYLDECLYKF